MCDFEFDFIPDLNLDGENDLLDLVLLDILLDDPELDDDDGEE